MHKLPACRFILERQSAPAPLCPTEMSRSKIIEPLVRRIGPRIERVELFVRPGLGRRLREALAFGALFRYAWI